MAIPPSNLQGPCPVCGRYFPDITAHYYQEHAIAASPVQYVPLPIPAGRGGICPKCKEWVDDLEFHLKYQAKGFKHFLKEFMNW